MPLSVVVLQLSDEKLGRAWIQGVLCKIEWGGGGGGK